MNIIRRIIEEVPNYETFMTVEELDESSKRLAEKYPDKVELLEIGKSRDGNSIICLKIGNGKKDALLYAFPHPNEPIGSLMLDYLSHVLVENSEFAGLFDYTWYIVKVSDPDGAKLNEGWFKGPFTPLDYALNFYRPAGNQQVEWTFPIEYKTLKFDSPIPETKALMNIIEKSRPDFIYSLHNAGFGGVYYYISEKAPILYPIYEKIVKDLELPLSLGEPEMPYAIQLDQAVYLMPTVEQTYDYYEKHSDKDPAEIIKSGNSSYGYAKNFNPKVFELVCEVPYYYDPRIEDLNEVEETRRELVLQSIEFTEKNYKELEELFNQIKDKLTVKTRFQEALEYFIHVYKNSIDAERKWAITAKELKRRATVAEKFDNTLVSRSYRMLVWGMFRRMLLENYERSKLKELKLMADKVYERMKRMDEELEGKLEYEVIPIKKLVQIQLAAGLYSALYSQMK